uniref:Uncharacterized protein n=1 Tax=Arundo donax TaxID=35708 RepID=A0A0A8YSZ1_ARUDO
METVGEGSTAMHIMLKQEISYKK